MSQSFVSRIWAIHFPGFDLRIIPVFLRMFFLCNELICNNTARYTFDFRRFLVGILMSYFNSLLPSWWIDTKHPNCVYRTRLHRVMFNLSHVAKLAPINSRTPDVPPFLSPTASLRMMHLDNEEKWRDPSKFAGAPPVMANPQVAPPVAPAVPQQAALTSPVASNQPSSQDQQYSRGSSLMRILGDGMVRSRSCYTSKHWGVHLNGFHGDGWLVDSVIFSNQVCSPYIYIRAFVKNT